ncbi:hypothetical protein GPJ59_36165, partial [Streptomyces bambusae]|nr:hypothetical protein [Streptomyces bambusae]
MTVRLDSTIPLLLRGYAWLPARRRRCAGRGGDGGDGGSRTGGDGTGGAG